MIFETKTFQIIQDERRAAAELTQILGRPNNTYYFNRLIVDKKLRGTGLSVKLMKQVIEWADQEKIEILLDINPYGNLDYLQLAQKRLLEQFDIESEKSGNFEIAPLAIIDMESEDAIDD